MSDPQPANPAVTDAESGRDAILRAARRAFAKQPYDSVTLRGIAADAGVSAALIVKHFGGKEQLFDVVADFRADAALLLDVPLEELGRHLVLTMLQLRRVAGQYPLLRVVFSLGAGDERLLLRERFREDVVDRLAARLTGPDAAHRAELVFAQVLGLSIMVSIDQQGVTATGDPERSADLYAPLLQALIDGPRI